MGSYPLPKPARALRVDQYILQGDAIAQQRGVGLMPHWLAAARLAAHPNTLELCLPQWQGPSLGVWLLYPHGNLPRKTRAFLDHVRRQVPPDWCTNHERADLRETAVPNCGTQKTGTRK